MDKEAELAALLKDIDRLKNSHDEPTFSDILYLLERLVEILQK